MTSRGFKKRLDYESVRKGELPEFADRFNMRSERKKGIKNDCQVVGITTDKWTCWMLTKLGKALRADVSGPAGNPSSVLGTVKFRAMPNPRDTSVGHPALKILRRENFTEQAKCGEERRHLGQTLASPSLSKAKQARPGGQAKERAHGRRVSVTAAYATMTRLGSMKASGDPARRGSGEVHLRCKTLRIKSNEHVLEFHVRA